MKSNKHVVIITPGFPENESDENCIPPLQQFIHYISKFNPDFKFSVIAIHYPYNKAQYKWNNINVYSCGGENKKFPMRFIIWNRVMKFFNQIKKDRNIDIIHSFWFGESTWLANKLCKKYNLPHICTLMGQEINMRNRYLDFINDNDIVFTAISHPQSKSFYKIRGKKVDGIIPWGISETDKHNVYSDKTIDLVGVGSLTKLKNYELFIKIVKSLKQNHPDIKAIIIGDGNERAKLEKLIVSFSLQKNIKLTGELKRSEVLEYMSRSKILLHTSSFESFGFVFAEALLNGLYIVSFKVGASEPSERWIVAKDENDMIHNIEKLLSVSLNHQPVNLFPLERTVEKYAQLYNRVISQ